MCLNGLSEVHEPQVIAMKQDVLHRNVAVANKLLVEVAHCLQQLPHPTNALLRSDAVPCLLQHAEEVAALTMLKDKPNIIIGQECLLHPEDVLGHVSPSKEVTVDPDLCEAVFGVTGAAALTGESFIRLATTICINATPQYPFHNDHIVFLIRVFGLCRRGSLSPAMELDLAVVPTTIAQTPNFHEKPARNASIDLRLAMKVIQVCVARICRPRFGYGDSLLRSSASRCFIYGTTSRIPGLECLLAHACWCGQARLEANTIIC
mmetsp:Transcript_61881/g.119267  ORF Transcript_61881/g.119267 Transcript_61881/m.119267 type:complete len:263 (+) Transcript_61881:1864-2652(+)